MIRQNSILMAQLMNPDVLVDIQMSRYGGFDYDKSEKIIAIGRQKTQQALRKWNSLNQLKSFAEQNQPSKELNN